MTRGSPSMVAEVSELLANSVPSPSSAPPVAFSPATMAHAYGEAPDLVHELVRLAQNRGRRVSRSACPTGGARGARLVAFDFAARAAGSTAETHESHAGAAASHGRNGAGSGAIRGQE